MSLQLVSLIPTEKKPRKLNLYQREPRGVSGTALIPDDDYLFTVTVFKIYQ
jgi:hypothetical protein